MHCQNQQGQEKESKVSAKAVLKCYRSCRPASCDRFHAPERRVTCYTVVPADKIIIHKCVSPNHFQCYMPLRCSSQRMTPAGLEPAIPGFVGRCLFHGATGPLVEMKSEHVDSAQEANSPQARKHTEQIEKTKQTKRGGTRSWNA